MDRGRSPTHAARRRLPDPRRHRRRLPDRSRRLGVCRPRPRRRPRPPGRGQLRERLLRRHPRHRRGAGRAGPSRRPAPGRTAFGQDRGVRLLLLRGPHGPGARRPLRAVGHDPDRRGRHRRGLVLHRRLAALRLPRAGRGLRLRLLRARRDPRHDGDDDPAHGSRLVGRHRRRRPGLGDPRGQQPARHPHRPRARQAHAGRPHGRVRHPHVLRRPRRRRVRDDRPRLVHLAVGPPRPAGRPARRAADAGRRGARHRSRPDPGAGRHGPVPAGLVAAPRGRSRARRA